MKKRTRQILALFLSVILVLFSAVNAAAVPGEENMPDSDAFGFTYQFVSPDTIEITSYSGYQSVVNVPSKIDGYTVVGIQSFHFTPGYGDINPYVNKVILPNTVTYIADDAFYESTDWTNNVHSELCEIVLPEGLKTIGKGAFYSNGELQKIEIPSSVTEIGRDAFAGCTNLSSIVFKGNNTFLHGGAFGIPTGFYDRLAGVIYEQYNNEWLYGENSSDFFIWNKQLLAYKGESKTPVIPDGVEVIGAYAFQYSDITSVTIPSSVKEIGAYAFYECQSLASVNIPSSVEFLDIGAFGSCKTLKSLTLNKGLKYISDGAFRGCEGLTSVVIPDTVTTIEDCAFYDCENLAKITVPTSVTDTELGAFGETKWLYSLADDADIYLGSVYCGRKYWNYGDYPDKITVKAGTKKVILEVYLENLKELILPDGLEQLIIEDPGYDYCKITRLDIPESVNYIYIRNMPTLTDVKLPKTAKLGQGCFSGCDNMNAITIPKGNMILDNVNVGKAEKIVLPDDVLELRGLSSSADKVKSIDLKNVRILGDNALTNIGTIESITIPDSVISLGDNAFSNCTSLKSIKGGKNVKTIGDACFSDCTALSDFGSLTSSTVKIDPLAFVNTAWFNSQPDGPVYFGKVAYAYKGEMPANTVLTIKEGTVSVSQYYLDGQTEINYHPDKPNLVGLTLPQSCKRVYYSAFALCNNLKYINLGGVQYIEAEAFNANGCESIVLPDSVRFVGDNAFSAPHIKAIHLNDGLVALDNGAFFTYGEGKGVTIPESVEYIGTQAFGYCPVDPDDYFSGLTKIDGFVIYGKAGTAAENYAANNEFTFNTGACASHDFVTENTGATCTSGGTIRKTCKICGYVSVSSTGGGAGHKQEKLSGKAATCTEPGLTDGVKCSVCGAILTEQKVIPATGHKYKNGVCTVCGAAESGGKDDNGRLVLKPDSGIEINRDKALVIVYPEKQKGMTAAEFRAKFTSNVNLSIADSEIIKNGMKFSSANTDYTVIVKGDVNADGKITTSDARTVLRIAARLETADEFKTYAADIDSNGKVSPSEARKVLRFAARLENAIRA